MSLVTLPKDFMESSGYNFWTTNNQLIIMHPFSSLYNRDRSVDRNKSSKEMTVIFLLCEPDPDKNKFYRIPYKKRLEMLKETYFKKFDEEDTVIQDVMAQYPMLCLSPVERALKEEIDLMVNRTEFLRKESKNLKLDRTEILDGKAVIIKGNAVQLDAMRAKTVKLHEDYEKLEKKFLKKKSESRLYGGRKKSKSEEKIV